MFESAKGPLHRLLKGYTLTIKSVFSKIPYEELCLPGNIVTLIVILAIIGLFRTVISASLGFRFEGGVWFSFDPGVIFTMLVFPVFLCFFPAMIMDYAFGRWNIKVKPDNILALFFFVQGVQALVPFLDYIGIVSGIPYYFIDLPLKLYYKLAVSPLAATPLIFVITRVSSPGINIAWIFVSIAVIKYGWYYKAPLAKFLLTLMAIFYIIYVVSYPVILLFYRSGNNFYYGMYFLVGSIGSILYFKSKGIT